jgi:glucose/mannose-6-phosphate isomerase
MSAGQLETSVLDTLDMFGAAFALPEQLATARAGAAEVDGLPSADGVTSVAILGMGGSGIGGDVCAAIAGPRCSVPIVVSKHYECPAFVGPDTLVVAVSFSGNTEETIAAVTAARDAGARIVVVAAGGELARLAGEWGVPHLPVDPTIPMPRAGIGAVSVPLLVLLERLGLADGLSPQIDAAIAQLETRRQQLRTPGNPAERLALRIGRTLPLVYGGGPLGEVAAWRWKGQFNENPKVPAWANRIPELTHNELAGWAQHGDVTRQVFTLLLLRHDFEHPNVSRRFEFVASACDEVVADILTVEAEGDGPFAQLMDLVLQGDLVTLHLSARSGVDPGPIAVLDDLKRWLRA